MYSLLQETRSIYNIIFEYISPSATTPEFNLIGVTGGEGIEFDERTIEKYIPGDFGGHVTRIDSVVEYTISEFEYMFISEGNPKGLVSVPIFKLGTNAKIPYEEALVLSGCLLARGLVEIDFNKHTLYPTFELMTLVNDISVVLKDRPAIYDNKAVEKAVRATALVTRVRARS